MRHKVPSKEKKSPNAIYPCFSFPAMCLSSIHVVLVAITLCSFGCASQQTKAWNHYEEGMLLVYKGYDAQGDKADKVKKAFNQAIECNKDLPGVRASLGTYLAKKGETANATELWKEEKKIHPESKKAMDVVLEKNEGKEDALAPETVSSPNPKESSTDEVPPDDKQTEPAKNEEKSV